MQSGQSRKLIYGIKETNLSVLATSLTAHTMLLLLDSFEPQTSEGCR